MDKYLKKRKTNDVTDSKEEVKKAKSQKNEEETSVAQYSRHSSYPFDIANPSFSLADGVSTSGGREIKKHGDLDLLYFSPLFQKKAATELYEFLLENMPWYRVQYAIGGRTMRTPRWTTVFGLDATAEFQSPNGEDPSVMAGESIFKKGTKTAVAQTAYKNPPRPLPKVLQDLRHLVEEKTGTDYNFCLVNLYLDGNDSISYHSDDEKFLGENPTVASLSLGSTRTFLLKQKEKENGMAYSGNKNKAKKSQSIGKGPLEKFELNSGDMVVMRTTTQRNWLHAIPKTKTAVGPRINITLRKALTVQGTNNYYHYNVHASIDKENGNEPHRYVDGNMVPQSEYKKQQ